VKRVWPFVVLVYAGAIALLWLLVGCAAVPGVDPDDWQQWDAKPTHQPLPMVWAVVDASQFWGVCGYAKACALRNWDEGVCYVYSPPHQPVTVGLRRHEKKHCDGYDHPAYWDFSRSVSTVTIR
jgi:hypothetical protein